MNYSNAYYIIEKLIISLVEKNLKTSIDVHTNISQFYFRQLLYSSNDKNAIKNATLYYIDLQLVHYILRPLVVTGNLLWPLFQ